MAGNFWGQNPGGTKKDVTVDTATTSKKVEVFVEDGVTELQALRELDNIKAVIKEGKKLP